MQIDRESHFEGIEKALPPGEAQIQAFIRKKLRSLKNPVDNSMYEFNVNLEYWKWKNWANGQNTKELENLHPGWDEDAAKDVFAKIEEFVTQNHIDVGDDEKLDIAAK